jgi:hypothetical protein
LDLDSCPDSWSELSNPTTLPNRQVERGKRLRTQTKPKEVRYKDGTITPYGFACGYTQMSQGIILEKAITLYFVKYPNPDGGYFWESFPSLTDARKRFAKLEKDAKNGKTG